MRILQVITSLYTGGAEKLVVQLAGAIREMGHEVDVALFDGTDTDFKKSLSAINCKVFSFSEGGSVYSPKNIFRLRKIMRKYDIVHTHNTSPQLFAALAKGFGNRPLLVTTEHSTYNRRRDRWYFRFLDKWMYGRYACIICISDIAKDKLVRYLGRSKNIVTIENGVDLDLFRNAEANGDYRKEHERYVVAMVAALRPGKDQESLIKAIAMLPDEYNLWIVGDGQTRSQLESLSKTLGVEDRVRFWGWRTDVPQILKSSDVVAMASHYEGLSLSSIEGMAVGKPFIASDVDGLSQIVGGAGVLLPDSDSKAFADKIKELCTDKEYAARVAESCMERAGKYDFKKMAEAYEQVYLELMHKAPDTEPQRPLSEDEMWIE